MSSEGQPCPACRGEGKIFIGECDCGGVDIGVGILHEPYCMYEQCPLCDGARTVGPEHEALVRAYNAGVEAYRRGDDRLFSEEEDLDELEMIWGFGWWWAQMEEK